MHFAKKFCFTFAKLILNYKENISIIEDFD